MKTQGSLETCNIR